ncbi:ParB/RepB/Spo0J family partition protein [Candidatus Saccharibacteria bacterium]|nr:ParB/RepB/Spo0J family partition protein [Candidatus Saccharibacteria bacterium]MBI3338391.1 ParB/RepB/Spo0J family partition protein [Candidatus Saccharibacteria bacterium]
MSRIGLGKGLDALIPKDFDSTVLLDKKERIQNVSVSEIQPTIDQPRRQFDETALNELAASIARYGILQPLIVTPSKDGVYHIIAGERRWRAAKKAGLKQLPVIIRSSKELERLEIALIENVQRVDLSPIEQAVSIERLHQQFNIGYSDIAERLGKATTTVNNIVRLLQLPEAARKALEAKRITEGHARSILALKNNPERQHRLLELIEGQGWSVRQAEQFVTAHKQGADTIAKAKAKTTSQTPETKNLTKKLGYPVSLRRTARGGRLEIHFKNDQELSRLIDNLGA